MKALTVAEYKRAWFKDKRAKLRARGLRDVQIAEQMGIKRSYFSQIVKGAEGDGSVGDTFIERMCSAFSLEFPDPQPSGKEQTSKESLELREEIRLLKEAVQRMMSLHTTLMEAVVKQQQEKASHS